jgi:hypothetical protein
MIGSMFGNTGGFDASDKKLTRSTNAFIVAVEPPPIGFTASGLKDPAAPVSV